MRDEWIYILRENGYNVSCVRCREFAQWWAEQSEGRGWQRLKFKSYSNEEATKIVDELILKKDTP